MKFDTTNSSPASSPSAAQEAHLEMLFAAHEKLPFESLKNISASLGLPQSTVQHWSKARCLKKGSRPAC
jgi:hypothetical protein